MRRGRRDGKRVREDRRKGKKETWPGVCLAVTLGKARGAEQPNYNLHPVP